MQFASLIYESAEAFAARNNDETDAYQDVTNAAAQMNGDETRR